MNHFKRGLKVIPVVALTYVLCASALLQPVAVYAATLQAQQPAAEAADASGTQDSSAGDVSDDTANEVSKDADSSGAAQDKATLADAADEDAAAPESLDAVDEQAADDTVIGDSEANSWRYQNGELRSDLQDDYATDLGTGSRSMHNMPENAIAQGIDVSGRQGDIDWQQVKDAGVDFAILKIGNINAREPDGWYTDSRFQRNLSECERLGIPYGIYVYSYAQSADEAVTGANRIANLLKGHSPTLPVYLDLEDNSIKDTDHAAIATAFCNTISAAGYTPGIYASASWFKNILTDPCFSNGGWNIWTAQYWYGQSYNESVDDAPEYPTSYDCWQYSSLSTVPGIDGNCDINYWYGNAIPSVTTKQNELRYYQPIFDADYYLENNPDVQEITGGDKGKALEHFLSKGVYEGRRGSGSFDVVSYYNEYPDLRAAFGTDIWKYYDHYLRHGQAEGRHPSGCTGLVGAPTASGGTDYSAVYDPAYYLDRNPDLKAAFSRSYGQVVLTDYRALLSHFLRCGMAEGRVTSPAFDLPSYYNANQDLRAAYGMDLKGYYRHYVKWGRREGRVCAGVGSLTSWQHVSGGTDYSPVYDGAYYFDRNPDLQAAFSKRLDGGTIVDDGALLSHFLRCGMAEGRVTSPAFDLPSYYNANQDLRAAYGMDLKGYYRHYVKWGRREGRVCAGVGSLTSWQHVSGGTDYSPVYDGAYYFDRNPDLQAAFSKRLDGGTIVDDGALLSHFLRYGAGEGRRGNESFDVVSYYNANEDLRAAFGLSFGKYAIHYARYGCHEGRSHAGVHSLTSFMHLYKGVELRAIYDGAYYYANNPDLQSAFLKLFNGISFYDDGALIAHFVLHGVYEGRRGDGSPSYNARTAKVLAVAAKEVGHHDLSDPQRGSKYGRWYAAKTGRAVFGYNDIAWCAMYTSWVLNQAGVNCAGMPGSGCVTIYRNAKGRLVPISEARAGDLILFDWNPWLGDGADHIGIVLENDGASFKTIEGNTSRSDAGSQGDGGWVAARTRPISKVYAIIRPYY